jgi:phosphatidylglycerophosphatase A
MNNPPPAPASHRSLSPSHSPEVRPRRSPGDTLAYVLSIWFGCGRVPYAPGTAGSLGAFPLYWLLRPMGPGVVLAAAFIVTAVGVWAAHRTSTRLGLKDPPFVCIDEVSGMLLTWSAAPPGWAGIVAGFVLFRIADQIKPWPARALERDLPGGFGIVLDDVAAGAWAAVALLAARAFGLFG